MTLAAIVSVETPILPNELTTAIAHSVPIPFRDSDGREKEYPPVLPSAKTKSEASRFLAMMDDWPRIRPEQMRQMLAVLNALCARPGNAPIRTEKEIAGMVPYFLRTLNHLPASACSDAALDLALSRLAYFPAPAQLLPMVGPTRGA
jgi:hypothetical protein